MPDYSADQEDLDPQPWQDSNDGGFNADNPTGEEADAAVVVDPDPTDPEIAPVASVAYIERLLKQWREGPVIRALCALLGTRHDEFRASAAAVRDAFDLTTAVGAQLDVIGRILDLPRLGDDDDEYRLALMVWGMVLTSHGWADEILAIVRTFIGPTPTLTLVNIPPMGYRLEIDTLALEQLQRLLVFVRAANPTSYGFSVVITTDTTGLRVDLVTPTVVGAHNVDVIGVVVTDPGVTATIFT